MASAPEELEAAVLALPREERARLAQRLISSLDSDEVEKSWREEVRRRLDAYRDGEIDTVAAEEVLENARDTES